MYIFMFFSHRRILTNSSNVPARAVLTTHLRTCTISTLSTLQPQQIYTQFLAHTFHTTDAHAREGFGAWSGGGGGGGAEKKKYNTTALFHSLLSPFGL